MDIPLHPAVVAEIARGRKFVEQLSTARRNIEQLRVTVSCPDDDNHIIFGGDGMIVDAVFTADIFDRYPGTELRDLLLTMSEEGFSQISQQVSAQVDAVLDQP